jgi:hypothetical protein
MGRLTAVRAGGYHLGRTHPVTVNPDAIGVRVSALQVDNPGRAYPLMAGGVAVCVVSDSIITGLVIILLTEDT